MLVTTKATGSGSSQKPYEMHLTINYLKYKREKYYVGSFLSLVKDGHICVNYPELPNCIYVSRADFIWYPILWCLRSPRKGMRDTSHESQGKVLFNHTYTKLSMPAWN